MERCGVWTECQWSVNGVVSEGIDQLLSADAFGTDDQTTGKI